MAGPTQCEATMEIELGLRLAVRTASRFHLAGPVHRIPAALDQALEFNLYRVALLVRGELVEALSCWGLTPGQWQVLQALWSTDDLVNQADVARLTLRDTPTVSRILVGMERDGWIERHSDPSDARVRRISLTAKAEESREVIPRTLSEHFDRRLSVLDRGEHAALLCLLKKVRARLEAEPAAGEL